MPSKDLYWNGAGIERNTIDNGLFISSLTKEIEIIYVNSEATPLASVN